MALNVSIISGRLTKDPELKSTKSGKNVCSFTVAVDKRGKDAGTNFIDCVAWEGRAETISKYFKKGSPIGITGRLDQQSWEQDGQKRSKLVLIVDDFTFLANKSDNDNSSEDSTPVEVPEEIDYSSIPF